MDIFEMVKSGDLPVPEGAKTLGFELISYSREAMEMKARFCAGESFLNPAGTIQGGFLCAMLDDVMGSALVFSLPVGQFAPTLELKAQFIRPAMIGSVEAI
ncbi:PaaI family thioesterase [Microbulbifer sp. SSSA002]|uniref:PaaI family thioesterase n=1 Tax=Microbulbifer sp. SSSA002 TaxID=3243376 RepID=UPI0040395EC1